MSRASRILLSSDEFDELAAKLSHRPTRSSDHRASITSAAALVREGIVVSAGDSPATPPLPSGSTVTVGAPTPYRLTQWTEAGPGWAAVNDRLELDVHGATSMTHLDTTEHFVWDRHPPAAPPGEELSDLASRGLVARGLLLDVAGKRDAPLGSNVVTLDDLQAALARTGATPRPGDALYFHFGRTGPARSDVPLGSVPLPGLSIECAEWLANIAPSAIVTDEGLDPSPSEVSGQPVPWHLIVLSVLRIPLVDRATLGKLAETCAALGRWEFLSVISPLAIPGASGSPVNPVAIF
jgi:kynurenine formamidase